MSDLIERDMLKKALTSLVVCSAKSHAKAYARCINVVERMPSARVEPENRVLTPDEILERDFVWLEETLTIGWARSAPVLVYGYVYATPGYNKPCLAFTERNGATDDYRLEDYGIDWRCWLRKPTKEETENTPWEE